MFFLSDKQSSKCELNGSFVNDGTIRKCGPFQLTKFQITSQTISKRFLNNSLESDYDFIGSARGAHVSYRQ